MGKLQIMVSINTSTSFLGTKKPEEPGSDPDASGLENIFASMLTLIEDENNAKNAEKGQEKAMSVAGLLEHIKNEIKSNQNNIIGSITPETGVNPSSNNILQIYQTYKTLIDDAIEIADEATVSFDMESDDFANLAQRSIRSSEGKQTVMSASALAETHDESFKPSIISNSDDPMTEFCNLEMQRIKASMKQTEIEHDLLKSNAKKATDTDLTTETQKASILAKTKNNSYKTDSVQVEQNKFESKMAGQTIDTPKMENSLVDLQASTKGPSSKTTSPEVNSQNSQNTNEAHLKLLEKNWGKDLAKIIEKAILSGKKKIDISLDPQKLGKMQLTLSLVKNQTSIFINTETTAASLILTNSEERLAQMFESSGYKLSNFQANSNGNRNSNSGGSASQQKTEIKEKSNEINQKLISDKSDQSAYTVDGRKVINIVA